MLKRTKIMATVGPACGSPERLRQLAEAGVDVFRINFSHGDQVQRTEYVSNIRAVEADLGRPLAIAADLCGPKIRVGPLAEAVIELQPGQQIVIQRDPIEGSAGRISTTFPELVDLVAPQERILLADGRLELRVASVSPPAEFTCHVVRGGTLSSGKGVNLPQTALPAGALTEKDRADVGWICQREFDFVALSFVRQAADIQDLRDLMRQHGVELPIIAKLENPPALADIDAIIAATDAVMVARGDLGVEMDFPTVPITQKRIADKCQQAGKPCIIATEMLESMVKSSRPTRAEISDVANAVLDYADAVMLSAETSIGSHPVAAVSAMQRAIVAAEGYLLDESDGAELTASEPRITAVLAAAIRQITQLEPIAAVVACTASGTSARIIAKNRLGCPVVAISDSHATLRRCCLYYGVLPQHAPIPTESAQLLTLAATLTRRLDLAKPGDQIIVVAGRPIGLHDRANSLVIEQV